MDGYSSKIGRDRERHRHEPYNTDVLGRKPGGNKNPPFHRVFISNVPYDEKWQNLKDLFRDKVGEVTYLELMTDDQGRSKGYGIVEFKTKELALEAVEKMRGHMLQDRNLVIKEDFYGDFLSKALRRDAQKNPIPTNNPAYGIVPASMPIQPVLSLPPMGDVRQANPLHPPPQAIHERQDVGNRPGIDRTIMDITGGAPLGNTVFVANLDYSVTYPKLKEVFSLAGNVTKIDMLLDNDNNSRGMANISFETDLEALQAISMFNKQLLFERPMVVKMDKGNAPLQEKVLPAGLRSIGPSLNISSVSELHGRQGSSSYGDSRNGSSVIGSVGDGLFAKPPRENIYGLNVESGGPKAQLGGSGYSTRTDLGELYSATVQNLDRIRDALKANSNHGHHGQSNHGHHGQSQGIQYNDRPGIQGLRYDHIPPRDHHVRSSVSTTSPEINSVYAVNLPYSLTWKEVKEKFSEVGNVKFVEIITENGKSKGQARIRYDSAEAASRAMKHLNGMEIEGRNIKVRATP